MNTLYYFWDEYPRLQALKRSEEARARAIAKGENPDNIFTSLCSPLSDSQKDLFEGTVTTYDLDIMEVMKEIMLTSGSSVVGSECSQSLHC